MAATAARPAAHMPGTSGKKKPVRSQPPAVIRNPHDGCEYIRKEMLGKGGFADCYLVSERTTNQTYAAKVVEKEHLRPKTKERLQSEVKIHRSLHHTCVVRLETVFEDSKFVYILLEVCPHKTLLEMVRSRGSLSEQEVRYWVYHIIEGIDFIHSQAVIHRDLKLGNIMVGFNSDGTALRPKIGDFGLATKLDTPDERKKTICGTPNYIAPEILSGGDHGHSYEVDVWSLGVIMYTLLFGRPPFESSNVTETYKLIKASKYAFPSTAVVSASAKEMIVSMLQVDPRQRPSLAQLRAYSFLSVELIPRSLPLTALSVHPGDLPTRCTAPSITVTAPSGAVHVRKALSALPMPSQPNASTTTSSTATAKKPAAVTAAVSDDGAPAVASDGGAAVRQAFASNGGSFVLNWRDFSAKYGLAYELQNGSVGACFNDNSRIVAAPGRQTVEYTEAILLDNGQAAFKTIQFSPSNYPAELTKKMKLLQHFIDSFPRDSSLAGCTDASSTSMTAPSMSIDASSTAVAVETSPSFAAVRRWKRAKNGMAFRLTHNLAQMNFVDHTKIFLDLNNQTCFYMDTSRKVTQYPIAKLCAKTHPSVHKRFRYAKQVFSEF